MTEQTILPTRILYTMLRVGDLDRSIAFYRDALGMREMRRETFPEGRFTLAFMGYGDSPSAPTIELTWNWDETSYQHGNGYGHIALEVSDIYAACECLSKMGVKITRPAGPMKSAPSEIGKKEVIAFLEDPDGYSIELIETAK
ncbi:Lactoylglutathione lyase [Roseovarius litorisediminis]|uniref:lactoylglutathione lyase n=1 Tax=Roseovarius litorisediminis TaxID=1312363 RepID=A0A1Y5RI79_9RHOB|nr:lactoylglutathione lyase [Roseovarius litorisediminis]SLN17837.1 Lactoylglutathione lyase [Roseovarius litorisediminis]